MDLRTRELVKLAAAAVIVDKIASSGDMSKVAAPFVGAVNRSAMTRAFLQRLQNVLTGRANARQIAEVFNPGFANKWGLNIARQKPLWGIDVHPQYRIYDDLVFQSGRRGRFARGMAPRLNPVIDDIMISGRNAVAMPEATATIQQRLNSLIPSNRVSPGGGGWLGNLWNRLRFSGPLQRWNQSPLTSQNIRTTNYWNPGADYNTRQFSWQ